MAFNPPKYKVDDDNELPNINCDYVSPSEMSNVMINRDKSFSLLTLNIRSCRKNFPSFLSFITTFLLKFTIIVLVETWLTEDLDNNFIIPGYNQVNIYRNSHGGGIKVFYIDSLHVEVLRNFTFVTETAELLTFYLIGLNLKILFCCIYRPPSSNALESNTLFFNEIQDNFPRCDTIVTGDINFNLYNPLKHRYITEFVNNFLGKNFYPIINIPTVFHENNPITKFSLIDHLWSNFHVGSNHVSGVIEYLISDHLPLFYIYNFNSSPVQNYITFRLFSPICIENFVRSIHEIDFSAVYEINEPNTAFAVFYDKLYDVYKRSFPIKKKKKSKGLMKQPWVSPKLKECIKKKYYLYSLLKRGIISRNSFKKYKKILNIVTRKIKQQFYRKKFECINKDPKKTWKVVNNCWEGKMGWDLQGRRMKAVSI